MTSSWICYCVVIKEPGAAEEDFARTGTETLLKIFLTYKHPGALIVPRGGFADWPDKQLTLPSWLSEKDIRYYAEKFDKTGFTGGLNYYRALDLYVLCKIWLYSRVYF